MTRTLSISWIVWGSLSLVVHGHMQMSWPFPLRSPLDPALSWEVKDYSMTSPLHEDGSDFPCKQYQGNNSVPQDSKAFYMAGARYNLTLDGYATHNGGSCQIALSYNNGTTFRVIKSIIGGCPLTSTYDFTIPPDAPASTSALLSWSWFNLVGNREMYQNCARVSIGSDIESRRSRKRQSVGFDDLPPLYVCNVNNGCFTVEGNDTVFSQPGGDVVYGIL